MKMTKRFAALVGAVAVVGAFQSAQAGLMVRIEGPGFDQTYTSMTSTLSASGLINGIDFTGNMARSNAPGTNLRGSLQITTITVRNDNPSEVVLKITTSDTNFSAPGVVGSPMNLGSAVGGTLLTSEVGDYVTFQSFADPDNAQPATAVATAPVTYNSTGPDLQRFSLGSSAPFVRTGQAYSMSNVLTIRLSPFAEANISGTTTTTVIPEPGALATLAPAALLLARRRRA